MPIAKVVVDLALDREFDYLIPERLADAVRVGSRVLVPFGPRMARGYVVAITDTSAYPRLKEISEIVGQKPLLSEKILELTRWMSRYYCCPVELCVKCALPDVIRKAQVGWKERQFARLRAVTADQLAALRKRAPKQAAVVEALERSGGMLVAALLRQTGADASTIKRLAAKGLIELTDQVEERDPFADEVFLPTAPLPLTAEQQRAFELICAAIREPRRPVLLHGVTGSGKTEVYLQAIEYALRQGKGAIVLVPEIALTPQTVERFRARFADQPISVLHSHLSAGERHDQWHKIHDGRSHIVIGARSAVFAPVQTLGLIIVDEEHETTYKQDEAPRYNARDVAVMRGQLEGAAVVLGSATPSLESYYNARRGRYVLATLSERVDRQKMPLLRIVDMRQEAIRAKSLFVLSQRLRDAIQARLERKEQVILFLNRRGYATHMLCTKCGYVARCPNCSIALTYHRAVQRLICHLCQHNVPAPTACPVPSCGDPSIRYSGMGTEKVEAAVQKIFPQARVQRMDSDMMSRKSLYREILRDFRVGRIDILVGTQMIAKGLHFPNVTLVGIIFADMALHLPDFRAAERTFQLLVQVAGRAGRGDVEGEVIVQSFTPYHPALQFARQHDYVGFYEQEIEFRQQLRYPPVTRLVCLTLRGRNEEKVGYSASALARTIQRETSGLSLLLGGPAPAPLARVQGQYRYQIILRTSQILKLTAVLSRVLAETKLPEGVSVVVDVDALSLL